MNKPHDLGGVKDKRPIPKSTSDDEKVVLIADSWTTRTLAITLAIGFLRAWNLDTTRFYRECLPPNDYRASSYYKRWFLALERMVKDFELLSRSEKGSYADKIVKAKDIFDVLRKGGPTVRSKPEAPNFLVGDIVQTKANYENEFVKGGHSRLPRYAMGKRGKIVSHHNAHVFPDSNAHFKGEAPEHLYSVEFSSEELWGLTCENKHDSVTLDLWEPYLEKADGQN